MEAVIGLLLMLLRVTHGVETSCDGRQDGAQCYGALGGTVVLQLMDSTSDIVRYQWSNKTGSVLTGGQKRTLVNRIEKRSVFTPSNGTFRINNLSRTDDGEYTLEIFDSNGKPSEKRTLQLTIQAPVSSVLLDTECLSQGELRVSCSSEGGDSPQYSWTLNGHTLTDAQLFPGNNETNIITLKQDVSGQLVCSVENHVSRVSKEVNISTCGFIFINCTLPNGTHISQWVFEANNSLCVEPTTTSTSPTSTEGVETSCDGRQNGVQCYGALGGTVVLQLMDSTSDIFKYQWSNKIGSVLQGGQNRSLRNRIENRSVFTPSNGTFRINNLSRTDDGEYTLDIFDSDGKQSEKRTLQLTIQAPVSSVLLDTECLSQGELRVSCSSEGGDSPQYSWTLNGHTLTDAQLFSGNNETNIITLKQDVSGQLVCSVENHVSRVSKEESISTCGFIFIACTLPNGTHISQWVFEANNSLCVEPTTTSTSPTTTEGVEISCDGRQNGAQCYGALGGTVVLQLMDSTSDIFKYQWSDKTGSVLAGGQKRPLRNRIEKRSVFTPSNGTFRINNLSRTDDGEYTLEIFDSNGKQSERRTLQLTIQAPVSSVLLDTECLSQGELRVSCSSEGGDSPQYSWTLNGHTLTDAQLFPGNNETNIITLKQDVSGQLVCSVENHVSRVSKEESISTCGFIFINCTLPNGTHISQWVFEANNSLCVEPTTTTTSPTSTEETEYLYPMVGILSALVILLVAGVAVMYVHKKKRNNKPKAEDDEQELTYADVKIVQQPVRQRQQKAEAQVEYGQIKFSEQPRQTDPPPRDECVYAMVRKGK
uniref:uncharacterized protein LOC124067792 isoform X4 n=1 Tax=Scatophagus argus TaxID=75038 RepID=UPI001ED85BBC|nr:uncharacterized protein LOC124067792 isoform X4 [Scatophagus argus]